MINDLFINGKDAYSEWGASMAEGFISAIAAPSPLKDYAKDESRASHGSVYILTEPRYAERDLTLGFTIQAPTAADYAARYDAFLEELTGGIVTVSVRTLPHIYRLIYTGKSSSYSLNRSGTFATIHAKFIEPDPSDRDAVPHGLALSSMGGSLSLSPSLSMGDSLDMEPDAGLELSIEEQPSDTMEGGLIDPSMVSPL